MMYEFIQIVCAVVVEPEWWQPVYDEYVELSGSSENKSLDLAIQINYITTRISIVKSIVERLWIRRNVELVEMLQDMGFPFEFTDLHADLDRVILMMKGDEIDLNRAVAEYKDLDQATGGKATVKDWYNILAMLGKHNNTVLNPKTLSVMEYISYDGQFRMWIEMNKPKGE